MGWLVDILCLDHRNPKPVAILEVHRLTATYSVSAYSPKGRPSLGTQLVGDDVCESQNVIEFNNRFNYDFRCPVCTLSAQARSERLNERVGRLVNKTGVSMLPLSFLCKLLSD